MNNDLELERLFIEDQSDRTRFREHELCILAISGGEERAKWLAAASEDRFLRSVGHPQRFGTQHWKDETTGALQLYRMDPSVSDTLRRAFHVPPLADAERRVERRNAGTDELSKALPDNRRD